MILDSERPDQGLLRRFKTAQLRRADPIQQEPRPSYVYRWCPIPGNRHISAMGKDGYERLGEVSAAPVTTLVSRWDRDWVKLHEAAAAAK